jgi:hypothetical protein
MRKSRWLIATAVILFAATAAAGPMGFLLGAIGLAVPYAVSLRLHPRTSHRACSGTGRHVSPLYPWANRRCQGCGGTGRQVRHGSRAIGTVPVRAEHRAGIAARAKMRQNRNWR